MTPAEVRERWPASPDCSCHRCRSYCQRPGWFLPDEVRAAANHLGITLKELFARYLVVDYWGADSRHDENIGVLSPGKSTEHGDIASIGFVTSGANCIFLKDGKCSIHPVKPHECRAAHHRHENDDVEPHRNHHLEVAKAWTSDEGRALLREVGYDPDDLPLREGDFFDMLDLLGGGLR